VSATPQEPRRAFDGPFTVRVPASSANLGPGFDSLGMALTLYAEVGLGECPPGASLVDGHHPAAVAFGRLGGTGTPWVRSPIPMGRGLGYSGAVRVGGAVAAVVQRVGSGWRTSMGAIGEVLDAVADLEGHADNAAASLLGGVVATAGGRAIRVPLGFDPAVVVWIPAVTTSTDHSRTRLPGAVSRVDAVHNIGHVAMLVSALAAGDTGALRDATSDRLHQELRFAEAPMSRRALDAGLEHGAWCGWLSGSGPTIALLCKADVAAGLAASLPVDGHTKVLRIDHGGAVAELTTESG
jgi:homoserine kinase